MEGLPEKQRWLEIAAGQRRYFNDLAGVFDAPQPQAVMDRLRQIVAAADLHPGDVGTGAGVLVSLIELHHPSLVIACDLAEQMLAHVHKNHPSALAMQCDVVQLPLRAASIDVVFMNAMYGNIADKSAACANVSRVLRRGGRLLVSHPEGRAFVDELRAAGHLFIESFPTRNEFEILLRTLGLAVDTYHDEPKLYLMRARKP